MRMLFGWIADPYVHIMLIAAALFGFATLAGSPDDGRIALVHCGTCGDIHEEGQPRCALVGAVCEWVGARR